MRRWTMLAAAFAAILLAGCHDDGAKASLQHESASSTHGIASRIPAGVRPGGHFADAPDHGALLAFADTAPVKKGAYTWHEVRLSEAHALRAIATGTMEVPAPGGSRIVLQYVRHEEHDDGNWTWIGRPLGARPGTEALITFGPKAVFASIPSNGEPLQISTVGGKAFLIETDPRLVAQSRGGESDFLVPSMASAAAPTRRAASAAGQLTTARMSTAAASTVGTTVDIVVGYTNAYATRLGGTSQARTRLAFLVDLANQAYANSHVDGRLRLVSTVAVGYSDTTSNRTTLFELSGVTCSNQSGGTPNLPTGGVSCTPAPVPATLQPLVAARDAYGADLVALVRPYQDPEQGSCGTSWMLGGAQSTLDGDDAPFAYSVVSDSGGNSFPDPDTNGTCRNEMLAHETGHNFGLQHDRAYAAGSNGTLDPDEFGHLPYAFGINAPSGQGNFVDIMGIRQSGQSTFLIFSNPDTTFCGGFACGIADEADSARALRQTIPIVARFRDPLVPLAGTWPRGDFNGDGAADIFWRNRSNGLNVIWNSANAQTSTSMRRLPDLAWVALGSADFNGDGASDVVWRNSGTGQTVIWRSANANTAQALGSPTGWTIVGAGDFNNDGQDDLLWRNTTTGGNVIWRSANAATAQILQSVVAPYWTIVGVGDFNGDGSADILWRNFETGGNVIWRSGNAASSQAVSSVNLDWSVAGLGDFDGDGSADILWRNQANGANAIWRSGNAATPTAIGPLGSPWAVMGVGDFDNDGKDDIQWRNLGNGLNGIWRSGNSATPQAVLSLSLEWMSAG